jgi:hypothetical protein
VVYGYLALPASPAGPAPVWPLYLAIALCATIAALGTATVWFQVRRAFIKMTEEDEGLEYARAVFDKFPDSVKIVLGELAARKSMSGDDIMAVVARANLPPINYGDVEKTGFVLRDPVLGRFHLDGRFEKMIPRLVKEWRAKRPT